MNLEDFKDSEHLVEHILKQYKLEDKKDMLELVEKISDSIAGKPVNFQSSAAPIESMQKEHIQRDSIKPQIVLM
jgi:hypothetical protein